MGGWGGNRMNITEIDCVLYCVAIICFTAIVITGIKRR